MHEKIDKLVGLNDKFVGLNNKMDKLTAMVEEVVKTNEKIAGDVADNTEKIKNLEDELIWRERKKRQVLIMGLKEPTAPSAEDRRAEDKEALEDILKILDTGLTGDDVKFVRRIGKANGGERPLCLGFYDEAAKDRVLRFSHRIKDTKWAECKLQPDLTLAQRKQFKDQMEEAKRKNATREGLNDNQTWRVVGAKGDTRLVRVSVPQ